MMKKLSLVLISLSLFIVSKAQITKGNWMVGGTGTFEKQQADFNGSTLRTTRLQLYPNIGYFFVDKLSVGLKPSIDVIKTKTDSYNTKTFMLGAGPFVRYYFLPAEKQVNLFTEGNYQYSFGTNKYYQNLYRISVGPEVFFNSSVGIELTANYEYLHRKGGVNSAKTFFIGAGFQIHLEKERNNQ